MKKIYIVDTNVFLQDPRAVFGFEDNIVVIPAIVLDEIDSKKTQMDEVGRNARAFNNLLDQLRKDGQLYEGVPLDNGGTLKIELSEYSELDKYFIKNTNDNRIISVASEIRARESKSERPRPVTLVSSDANVRVKADALGIKAERYMNDRVMNTDRLYKGSSSFEVGTDVIDRFYANKGLDLKEISEEYAFQPNEFVIMKAGGSNSGEGRVSFDGKKLEKLVYERPHAFGIKPRKGNRGQKLAFELLLRKDIPLVTMAGKAGTGKTLLALAAGLRQVKDLSEYNKILVARSIVPLGGDIGFLPGEKEEKLRPWIQPIYDNLEYLFDAKTPEKLEEILVGLGNIEVEALTYVRGRSIPGQFIIVDEVQNLTKHEVKTILTRVGEDSKIVLMGDPAQIDHPYLDEYNNGLAYVIERFKGKGVAGHITLEKGERSTLAQIAADIL